MGPALAILFEEQTARKFHVRFFVRELTSAILIESVYFIERKCSLDSEFPEYEGICAIEAALYWFLEQSVTD